MSALSSRLAGEGLRFAIVGVLATLTHVLVLTFAVEVFSVWPAFANGLAFAIALSVTYLGQSRWVFSGAVRSRSTKGKFLLSAGSGFLLNVGIMAFCTEIMSLPYGAGFLAATVIVPALSFIVNRTWVFQSQTPHT